MPGIVAERKRNRDWRVKEILIERDLGRGEMYREGLIMEDAEYSHKREDIESSKCRQVQATM